MLNDSATELAELELIMDEGAADWGAADEGARPGGVRHAQFGGVKNERRGDNNLRRQGITIR